MSLPARSSFPAARGEDRHPDALPGGPFAALGLPDDLLRTLPTMGYTEPTAIQSAAIPALVSGRDVVGVAQTGTGKTAAFGLPLLAAIDAARPCVQALVLVPTRELAVQAADALTGFARSLRGVAITAIYGGAPIGRQISALRRGAQVVVGTPGRVIDLLQRGALQLADVGVVVLDEADEMLRMGFAEDVDRILSDAPVSRQTALFSATMPQAIRRVAARHLNHPEDVSVAASATPVAGIDQGYAVLRFRDKAAALTRVIATAEADATVVFVRTRSACDELGTHLLGAGIKAAVISGDVTQIERERTIDRLRRGAVDVLVATDVAARGMDVERIGLVVNFDAPADPETYIHRVGRTGRAGRSGRALTFFTPKETSRRRAIERTVGSTLAEVGIPSAAEVRRHRAERVVASASGRIDAGRLTPYVTALRAAAESAGVDVEEIAAALVATAIGDDGATRDEKISAPRPADRGHGRARSDRHGSRGGRPRAADRAHGATRGQRDGRDTRTGKPPRGRRHATGKRRQHRSVA